LLAKGQEVNAGDRLEQVLRRSTKICHAMAS
jgi:hypothetical protein